MAFTIRQWSIGGPKHEFTIYEMRQRARTDNVTIFYCKKQIDVRFSIVCPIIDNEFRHNIIKVSLRNHSAAIGSWQQCYN